MVGSAPPPPCPCLRNLGGQPAALGFVALPQPRWPGARLPKAPASVRDPLLCAGAGTPAPPPCSESRERQRQRQLDEGADPEEAAAGWQGTEAEATELMVYHAAILRNKRLLFTYV